MLKYKKVRSGALNTFLSVLGFLVLSSKPSFAHPIGLNLAGTLGPGVESSDRKVIPIYGLTLSYAYQQHYEFGVEFEMTGSVPTFGVDFNYYFSTPLWGDTHPFLGIQAGLDFDSPHITEYFGPQAGFDIPISARMYIGPEFQYLYTIHDRGGILETLVNFKYFF